MTTAALRPLDFEAGYLDDPTQLRLGLDVRLRAWISLHAASLGTLLLLLPGVAVLHAWNMYRSPGINITDDEGTYVSQAYAVDFWHRLAHYTYWYDHPPLGWMQLGGYAWLTDAWHRAPYSVAVGREFMYVVDIVTCALLFGLARRLGVARWAAALAVVLFAASPLALHYHRMVWLDNVGALWIGAALFFAVSPRRSLAAAVGSALCLTLALLSKETTLVLAPAVVYGLWQNSSPRTRRYRLVTFTAIAGTLGLFYPLYALLKSELIPGKGHVSLLGAMHWQLTARASNGSILTRHSGAADYLHSWLQLDPWLLAAGLLAAVPAIAVRQLRPLVLALALEVVLPLRHGYLPEAYVVALLPFPALLLAAAADRFTRLRLPRVPSRWSRAALALPVVLGLLAVAPSWVRGDRAQLTGGTPVETAQAVAWVKAHVQPGQHMVTDDNVWLDLVRAGYDPRPPRDEVVWVYKVGTDPMVRLPQGLKGVDYFVYAMDPINAAKDVPEIVQPYLHSRVVATFGSGDNAITVRKVMN